MLIKSSRLLYLLLFASISISLAGNIHAQLDPTFGNEGVVTADLGSEDAMLAGFALPDGKTMAVAVALVNNQQKTFFLRYNGDGSADATYGTNGRVQLAIPFFNPSLAKINNAVRQPDGKIVIVGYDNFNGDRRPLVARYQEDGTLDTTFAQGNGISRPNLSPNGDDRFYSALLQPDGKILLAGGSNFSGPVYPNLCLMRYTADGAVDTGFGWVGMGFIVHTSIIYPNLEGAEFFHLQSNGKIIVGSLREQISAPDQVRGVIRRFNADGTADNGFTVLTFPGFEELHTVFVQPDDKILVGSQVTKTEPLAREHRDARLARYQADGSVDAGFGDAGQTTLDAADRASDLPKGFQVLPDGQILVALNVGIAPNRSRYRGNWLALARLSANGAVNGKFLAAPTSDNHFSFVTILSDGKILTAVRGRTWNNARGVTLVRAVGVPLQNYLFHAIPLDFAPGLSGATDPAVFRPGFNRFHFYPSTESNVNLTQGDVLAPADYIGNFLSEIAYFRPSTGTWHIVRDFWSGGILTIRWGADGDVPAPADYNGDGKADPAVFRPSEGVWYIYHIADGSYRIQQWGINGDKPVPGDYDGDGRYDIAIFRPSNGQWWILRSSDGGVTAYHFGLPGDVPVQEDYDGDGKFDIAVYRPADGIWYRLNSGDGSFFAYRWGLPGDIPVPGNYDSDQKANIAVWRPSIGMWFIVNPDLVSMMPYTWGINGDIPLPAKY